MRAISLVIGALLLSFAAGPANARAGSIIYVNQGVSSGDGSSWAQAFADIQQALAAAQEGDEIWVAAGCYVPGALRTSTFQLKPGVALYGGFAGAETGRDQRDWSANGSVLCGDLLGDDLGFDNNIENVYHVVTGADNATLDGFVVRGGNANIFTPENTSTAFGGGMRNASVSPVVANCSFSRNQAKLGGGGMYNSSCAPTVSNCTFIGNQSTTGPGGAMYNNYAAPSVAGCTFIDNSASEGNHSGGGAICNYNSSYLISGCLFARNTVSMIPNALYTPGGGAIWGASSSLTITNCIFIYNAAAGGSGDGGALCFRDPSSQAITNCTFSYNTAGRRGGALYNSSDVSADLVNCILWDNRAGVDGDEIYNGGPTTTIRSSDIRGCGASGASWNTGLGIDAGGNIDAGPLLPFGLAVFQPTNARSPWVDTGTTDGAPAVDIFGSPRPRGAGYDMGAIEYRLPVPGDADGDGQAGLSDVIAILQTLSGLRP